jgi:hypothetical protein
MWANALVRMQQHLLKTAVLGWNQLPGRLATR